MTTTAPLPSSATARFIATHTVLSLDTRHPFVAKSLVDAQDMHRTVMSGFRGWVEDGDPTARSQMGVLSTWAVDLKENALVLVVQSQVPGDWSRIPRAALTARPHTLTVDHTFRAGQTVAFRTVVNPTRNRPPAKGSDATGRTRGARIAHTTPHHAKSWFVRRLQQPGEPRVAPDGVARIGASADPEALGVRMLPTVSSPGPHRQLRVVRAEIRGTLTVTDPATLVDTLAKGVGHARAYGCGLLLTR